MEIRWCPAERLGDLQAFIDAYWKKGHILGRDAELLLWQHPPRGDGTLPVLTAFDPAGDIRGILGIIPVPFCAHGERHPGSWLTTWVVMPEERNTHLGLALLRDAMDQTPGLVGTLGGNAITMRILRALRYHADDSVPRWVRPLDLAAFESLIAAAGLDAPQEAWEAWGSAAGAPVPAAGGFEVAGWSEDVAASWDDAWRSRFASKIVGTWRDAEYLRWRYVEHPRFRYEVRFARRPGGPIEGLLVFRLQRVQDRDEGIVRIVELLGEPAAADELVASVLAETDDGATAFADFYCTSPRFAAPFERAGFVREPVAGLTLPALFQPLDARRTALTAAFWAADDVAGGTEVFAGGDVYFTRSDCDQDRPN